MATVVADSTNRDNTSMPLNWKEKLRRNHVALVDRLRLEIIIEDIIAERIIEISQVESKFMHGNFETRQENSQKFLDILEQGTEEHYYKFVSILRKNWTQFELAELLEPSPSGSRASFTSRSIRDVFISPGFRTLVKFGIPFFMSTIFILLSIGLNVWYSYQNLKDERFQTWTTWLTICLLRQFTWITMVKIIVFILAVIFFKEIVINWIKCITKVIKAITNLMQSLINSINGLINTISSIINRIKGILRAIRCIGEVLQQIPDYVTKQGRIEEIITMIIFKIIVIARPIVYKIIVFTGPVVGKIQSITGLMVNKIKCITGPMVSKIIGISGPTINEIKGLTGPIVSKIIGITRPMISKIKCFTGPTISRIKGITGPMVNRIKGNTQTAINKINGIVNAVSQQLEHYSQEHANCTNQASNIDASIIVIGLGDEHTVTTDSYQISLQEQSRPSTMKAIPTQMSHESQACVHGNSVYVTGTGGKRPHNKIWRLDLSLGDWFSCTDMMTGRRRHCAVIFDLQLYVLGGWMDATCKVINSIESYNIVSNSWSAAGNLYHAVHSAACITYKNFIYVFGGIEDENKAVPHVQKYDPTTQQCVTLNTLMPAAHLWRAAQWATSVILMCHDTCLVYNFETKTWLERNQFKTNMDNFGLVMDNQNIYIVGGGTYTPDKNNQLVWSCTDEINSVSVLDIIEDKPIVWKNLAKLPKHGVVYACCLTTLLSSNSLRVLNPMSHYY